MKNRAFVVISFSQFYNFYCDRIPVTGETLASSNYREAYGGKGTSQAYAVSHTGCEVKALGRIGDDGPGKKAFDNFNLTGVGTEYIVIDKNNATGRGTIIRDPQGKNLITLYSGANNLFSKADFDAANEWVKTCEIGGFQFETCYNTVEYAIKKTHSLGIKTFLDPAPARKIDESLLRYVSYIKPNEYEASIITGINVNDVESAKKAGSWFLEHGVNDASIITLGSKGAVLTDKNGSEHYPAPDVTVVDTVSAGDAFAGGFIGSVAAGNNTFQAFVDASTLSAVVVHHQGTLLDFFDCKQEFMTLKEKYLAIIQ